MALSLDKLKILIRASLKARPVEQEMGCDDCSAQIGQFAETILAGKEIPDALRLVQWHLESCPPCKEEFEALLVALRAMGNSH